jgi:hypothetical protein
MVKNHAVCCSDENEVCLTTCAIAQTRGEALMTSDEMTFEASPSLRCSGGDWFPAFGPMGVL